MNPYTPSGDKSLKDLMKMKEVQVFEKIVQNIAPNMANQKSSGIDGHNGRSPSPPSFYENVRSFIFFGRATGIVPCGKSTYSSYKQLKLSLSTIPVIVSCLLICYACVEVSVIGVVSLNLHSHYRKHGIVGYALGSHFLVQGLSVIFRYMYFLWNSDKLFKVFETWEQVNEKIGLFEDKMQKFLPPILFLYMIPTAVSFLLFFVDTFDRLDGNDVVNGTSIFQNISGLEQAYNTILGYWKPIIPFNGCLVVFQLIMLCVMNITQMFICPIIIMFSFATSRQFKLLLETAAGTSLGQIYEVDLSNRGTLFWQDLVIRYKGMCLLVKSANNFLSPLVFEYVSMGIYSICMDLFKVFSGVDSMAVSSIVFVVVFLVEVFNLFAALFMMAEVNSNAVQILEILKKCKGKAYHEFEVDRLEIQVSTGLHIGFSGLNFYNITKPFLLSVLGTIFTVEIIMLQSATAPIQSGNSLNNSLTLPGPAGNFSPNCSSLITSLFEESFNGSIVADG